jgi:hypothetical protein
VELAYLISIWFIPGRSFTSIYAPAIIINATSHYVCFLEFHVTDTYLEDLNLGQIPSEPLKVTATHWFDLSDIKGRRGVLDNIRGLVGMAVDN